MAASPPENASLKTRRPTTRGCTASDGKPASIDPGTPVLLARAKHREWLSEIESRVANIRAEKKGEGRLLAPKDARALAGEWYRWFTEKHTQKARTPTYWEDLKEHVGDALRDELVFAEDDVVDEVWERSPEARADVRPMLADWGETSF